MISCTSFVVGHPIVPSAHEEDPRNLVDAAVRLRARLKRLLAGRRRGTRGGEVEVVLEQNWLK